MARDFPRQIPQLVSLENFVFHHRREQFFDGPLAELLDDLPDGAHGKVSRLLDGAIDVGPPLHLEAHIPFLAEPTQNRADS